VIRSGIGNLNRIIMHPLLLAGSALLKMEISWLCSTNSTV